MPKPADTTPPPAPPATPPPTEDMDPTFQILFAAADSEKPVVNPTPESSSGKSLIQAINEPAAPELTPEEKAKADKEKQEKEAKEKAEKDKLNPPPPADKTVKVTRKAAAAPATPPAPAAPTPPPAPKEKTADEKFEEALLEEERDQLELARFAEKKDPAKYKGLATKTLKFLRDHQEYLEKNPKALEQGTDEASAYETWLAKNNAKLPAREARLLEHEQIREATKADVTKDTDAKFADIHDDNFRRDEEPKIKAFADQMFNQMAAEALPEDLAKAIKEQGMEKAKALFPLEFKVANEVMTEAAADAEELTRITTVNPRTQKPVKAFDANNPQHKRILEFMREQCAAFKNGQEGETPAARAQRTKLLTQEGKQFLTRDEYYSLAADQRAKYWTFTIPQIVLIRRIKAKGDIDGRIKAKLKEHEDLGFVRKPAGATPPPAPPPAGSPPAPRPAPPPPGGGDGAEKPDKTFSLLMGE